MPVLTTARIPIQNGDDPSVAEATGQIDLAVLASEYYGKNIRQGQTFKVKAVSMSLVPANNVVSAGIDIGISAVTALSHIPTTSHSRKAWNNIFSQWRAQKNLAGKVGKQIRFDDMEFAWNVGTQVAGRTSTIRAHGINDMNDEKLVLVGDSTAGSDLALQDYYNSTYPSSLPSFDQFSGSAIKQPKYGSTMFPDVQKLYISGFNSAQVDYESLGNEQDGAVASDGFIELITPHNVMCGLYHYDVKVMPDDTATQIEEDFEIVFSFHVQSFKPLVYRPRARKKKGYSRKGSSRKGMRRSGR